MKVYVVLCDMSGCDWPEVFVEKIFSTREAADEYVEEKGRTYLEVSEHEVEEKKP